MKASILLVTTLALSVFCSVAKIVVSEDQGKFDSEYLYLFKINMVQFLQVHTVFCHVHVSLNISTITSIWGRCSATRHLIRKY